MKLYAHHVHQCSDPWEGATPRDLELREMLLLIIENQEVLMGISPQVQAVLDAINAQPNIAAAVDAGFKAESAQITDLQSQVKSLQDQISTGGTLSADDDAALASGLATLQQTNASLQKDVPANAAPAAG